MKDPAFLFYSSDFLTGTMFMNNEQVGKYIRLLCAQHQIGHLNEKDMLNICKTYDKDIFEKFTKDEAGKYYNVRLESETNKRIAYSNSRRINRSTKQKDMMNICKSYDEHMENENININIDKDKRGKGEKRFSKPTLDEVIAYCQERRNSINAQAFIDFYESKGWKIGDQAMKDWKAAIRTWEQRNKSSPTISNKTGKANFEQRTYTKEELDSFYEDVTKDAGIL
jgi:hypothetical protein